MSSFDFINILIRSVNFKKGNSCSFYIFVSVRVVPQGRDYIKMQQNTERERDTRTHAHARAHAYQADPKRKHSSVTAPLSSVFDNYYQTAEHRG